MPLGTFLSAPRRCRGKRVETREYLSACDHRHRFFEGSGMLPGPGAARQTGVMPGRCGRANNALHSPDWDRKRAGLTLNSRVRHARP